MADSGGNNFPVKGINVGHIHQDLIGGGIYRYLGGTPTDIANNWLLFDGEISSDPDTSSWGTRQDGAKWFNTADNRFKGWNGSAIIARDTQAVSGAVSTIQNNGTALTQRDILNFVGKGFVADDNSSASRVRIFDPRSMTYIQDDFIGGNLVSGSVGELLWYYDNLTLTYPSGSILSHPGTVQLSVAGLVSAIQMNGDTSEILDPADFFDCEFIFKLNNNDSATAVKIGFMTPPLTFAVTNGIFIEKKQADTSFFGVTRAASTESRTAAIIASDTNWHSFRVRRNSSTVIAYSIDSGTEVTLTTNIPTANLHAAIQFTADSGTKTALFDMFSLLITGLNR